MTTASRPQEARERLIAYLDIRAKRKGLDAEHIHGFDGEYALLSSDIRLLLDAPTPPAARLSEGLTDEQILEATFDVAERDFDTTSEYKIAVCRAILTTRSPVQEAQSAPAAEGPLSGFPEADKWVECGEARPLPMFHLSTVLQYGQRLLDARAPTPAVEGLTADEVDAYFLRYMEEHPGELSVTQLPALRAFFATRPAASPVPMASSAEEPDGWRLVPIKATQAMWDAAEKAASLCRIREKDDLGWFSAWDAMLDAAPMKQGAEPLQADPLSDLRERSSGVEGSIVHDWRSSDKLGGEVCANCSAMKGTRRGNEPCGAPPAASLREQEDRFTIEEIATACANAEVADSQFQSVCIELFDAQRLGRGKENGNG